MRGGGNIRRCWEKREEIEMDGRAGIPETGSEFSEHPVYGERANVYHKFPCSFMSSSFIHYSCKRNFHASPSVCASFGRSVGCSIGHNFLKVAKFHFDAEYIEYTLLRCSYRTFFILMRSIS